MRTSESRAISRKLLLPPVLLPLLLSVLLQGCMPSLPAKGPVLAGNWLGVISSDEVSRKGRYVVHVPEHALKPAPLVVVLHGVANTASSMAHKTRMNDLAEKHGFIALYPEGLGFLGRWQHWNAGFCCGLAHERQVDDIAFVRQSILEVQRRLDVDGRRVYLVGHSNGGMLAYAYAARHPRHLRGFAVVAGTAGGNAAPGLAMKQVQPRGPPVPLVVIHGENDHVMPLDGGGSSNPFLAQYGERLSLQDSVDIWLRHNGCKRKPREKLLFGERVLQRDWCVDAAGRRLRLLLVRDWPHAWPGPGAQPVPGHALPHGFSAEEAIWSFFQELER